MRLLLISSLALCLATAQAQKEKWTPEEIIHTQYLSGPSFSDDASMIVWSKKEGLKEKDKFVSKLYLTRLNLDDKGFPKTVQLTRGESNEYNTFFSKNGEYIYFLSSRDKGKKLWKLSIYGGEPEEVHEFKNGISNTSLLNDSTLIFVSGEGKSLYQLTNEKDDTKVIEDSVNWPSKRLFSFNLKSKTIQRLTTNHYQITSYSTSENGQYVMYMETTSPHYGVDGKPAPNYVLKNLLTGVETSLFQELQTPGSFRFTRDGSGFYFTATRSSNPEWQGAGIEELYFFDLKSKRYSKVELDWENGISNYHLVGNDVLAELANGPYYQVNYYHKKENTWIAKAVDLADKQLHVSIMAVSKTGQKVLYAHSTASQLPEYYIANITSKKKAVEFEKERKLVSLNENLKKKTTAKAEVIYWKGANDEEISGILYYPKNYQEGKQYPLILSIHGGPTGVDKDRWSDRWSTYPQILTDKGAFVLKPNYHGSGSHSLAFIESIKNGNYYSLEQIDIYNGIQHLLEQGMVDRNKLGTMGWSNGAILTTWMTLKYPDLFQFAAPGAGDINWTSDYGTCQFGVTFDQSYFGGAPWDDMNGKHYNEWYINNSPIFEIEKIKTPTIIFHGSEDRAVPRDQGWEYYRGLQQVGQAPVKFLWFPGQPHGLQKITHQLRKMKEEIAWIDRYLFDKQDERNASFKDDSPLASLLALDSLTVDGLVGIKPNQSLLPAVTPIAEDSIQVGVFEVTVAQFHTYTGKTYDPLHANQPITNLTKDQIMGYLNWLKETTSMTYRLPNAQEAKSLHQKGTLAAEKQNNLNYYAGYQLTQPDASQLSQKLRQLQSSLLLTVGSKVAVTIAPKAKVFDLGGNVAEYYLDDGQLKIYDYSAYDFVDSMNSDLPAASQHVGFRVILDTEK